MSPAVLFTVTWRACLPGAEADRYCPYDPTSTVADEHARDLATRWLTGTWSQLWRDLAPVEDPERAADAACWHVLTAYGDGVHGPAAYDAVRDIARRALSRTGLLAAAALAEDAARSVHKEAFARAVLGAVGPRYDPWRPRDFASYDDRYGYLLGVGWANIGPTVARGQHLADNLRRALGGSAVEV